MNINTVILQHKRVCNFVVRRKVKQSFDIMADMLDSVSVGGLRDEFHKLQSTYMNILTYTVEGISDPERHKVYLKLMRDILRLNDRIKQDILAHHSAWYTYSVRDREQREERLRGGNIIESVDNLVFKSRLDEILSSAEIINTTPESDRARETEHLSGIIFNHLWLADFYGEAEESLMNMLATSGKFEWHEMASYVSAVTLSSLRIWDPAKLQMLGRLTNDKTPHVAERAITGLIFSLYYYSNRLSLYPEVMESIMELAAGSKFRERSRMVVLQAVRSRDTEKLSKRMNEEILPKVVKLRPRIEEKLDLDMILGENPGEGQNPDWSDMFSGSEEMFKTMEELSNLQMEGSDVYMSAFSGLKKFDFFRELRNWFIPFYPDHIAVDDIFRDEILGPAINELAEALYKTPFICNSDKFSLILNMKHLPAEQKSMMLKVFRMELEGLEQMKYDGELTDPEAQFRTNVTQYIHDLYRFYKLSDFRNEFEDLFTSRLDIYNSLFYREICGSPEDDRSLADYFFSKEYYSDALSLYLTLISTVSDDAEIYEKAGYCYQKEGEYEKAVEAYSKAALIDPKSWTLRKTGYCLRRLGRSEEALEAYLRALKNDPDDQGTILMTAHCYLDNDRYEEALKHYFRIEYESPGNVRVLRPIAWCYLMTGKYREAAEYFGRLAASGLTPYDLVNMGHLALLQGSSQEAAAHYISALEKGQLSTEAFINIVNDDTPMLTAAGVSADDLPIVLDYVLMSLKKDQ
ncbi:MAG: tetratricopeptide repeat protein [Bacteroidales bacterium]|nr:tetratricopeptide repeat protein [Bacteroidales bacterium]MDT8373901.1 tetratricopeptide repeat protein [Bacteroidales bacterium]